MEKWLNGTYRVSDQEALLFTKIRELRESCRKMKVSGERFTVPREGKPGVEVIINRPGDTDKNGEKLYPVLFNMHGGGYIGGDAAMLNSMCETFAKETPCVCVNINYTKVDVEPFPYQMIEAADTVNYFIDHAEDIGIDPEKIALIGESAGAHLAAGTTVLLSEQGVKLSAQILIYPVANLVDSVREETEAAGMNFVKIMFPAGGADSRYASPARADREVLSKLPPAVIVICGKDTLKPCGEEYCQALSNAGVEVHLKEYPLAEHGFIEVNRDDSILPDPRKTPEQAEYSRDCERYVEDELRYFFGR